MIRYISLLLLLLMFGAATCSARSVMPLNGGWNFRFAHEVSSQGRRVDLPHTWNAQDALAGNPAYYRGMGVYEKRMTPRPEWRGKRVYLKFHGANESAAVFVNTRFAAEHKGGYTAFVVDITDMLDYGKENTLTVKVTNALDLGVMPLVGDFNMYGGLYRNVDVVTVDPLHISLTDYASPGVYLTQRNVSHDKADIDAAVFVCNHTGMTMDATVRLTVLDGERVMASTSRCVNVAADTTERVNIGIMLEKPHLWDGVNDPFMYTVVAQIENSDGTVCDVVNQPLGLRYYSVDAENGFMLNGRPMRLRGVCHHQDRAERGNALLPQHHAEDAAIIKEIGANAVRLAHYPQADEFYSLMDKYGMIVWAEIPFIGPGGYHDRGFNNIPSFKDNGCQQLCELIRQNYNHPSICFWGLFNELKTSGDSPFDYVTELNELAHAEDPSRLTTAASFLSASDTLNLVTDVIAWNQYFGWYGGSPDDLGHWLDETHRAYPSYRIGLSEYGAGASIYHQQDSVKRGVASGWWHPENYQTYYHIGNWKAIDERPYVWGSFIWNLFDFGAAHRTEGDRPGINDKGLVTFDRTVKKDAFYFYKANWNDTERFVYIANRRHTRRTQQVTTVTIFSNEPEVVLTVNGRMIGRKKSDGHGIFTFPDVKLAAGKNLIEASSVRKGSSNPDRVEWTLEL